MHLLILRGALAEMLEDQCLIMRVGPDIWEASVSTSILSEALY